MAMIAVASGDTVALQNALATLDPSSAKGALDRVTWLLYQAGDRRRLAAFIAEREPDMANVADADPTVAILQLFKAQHTRGPAAFERILERTSRVVDASFAARFFVAEMRADALVARGDLETARRVLEAAASDKAKTMGFSNSKGYYWLRCVVRLLEIYRALGRSADVAATQSELQTALAAAHTKFPLLARVNPDRPQRRRP